MQVWMLHHLVVACQDSRLLSVQSMLPSENDYVPYDVKSENVKKFRELQHLLLCFEMRQKISWKKDI